MSKDKKEKKFINLKKIKDLKINKPYIKIVAISLVGIISIGASYTLGKNQGRLLPASHRSYNTNKVMAKVGDVEITGKDLEEVMEPVFYLQGKTKMTEEEIDAYEYSMLDYMTTKEALYLEGKANNVSVTDEEVEKEYETTMSSTTSEFGMTEEEYLSKFGLTKDKIKKDLEKELIAVKYMGEKTDVTEEEAKNYYDKNQDEFLEKRASHILIKTTDDDGNELSDEEKQKAKKKAEELLSRVKNGEDFATLAKEYSEDTSASDGGDIGYFKEGELVDSFEKAVESLDNGEVYPEVVESDYGYHIIKKTGEKQASFDDEKESLITQLSYNKQNTLIEDILSKYNVEIKES
ncbi:MAG: peptidylprolyl isomerase [Romboutsia sp.]|nr:peptidylprolyl isomerase [Romboutsia sp.]